MSATGERFAGYELEEFLGDGGLGAMYRARDLRLRRQVALRIVAPDVARDPVARERLNRESTALGSVDHPNVTPIYETGELDGQIFIASRWVEGTSLSSLVRDTGPLEPRRAVKIVNQVAAALQAAHSLGIIHRNVKPSSILVTATDHAYLTDFGLARRPGDLSGLTVQQHLFDSFDYVAPEHIEGDKIDYRVDIYGLGCVLYEAVTGEVPFPGAGPAAKMYAHARTPPPSARSVRPEVSEHLDAVIRRAMAKRPEDRQQSAGEFAVDAAGGTQMSAPPWALRPAPERLQGLSMASAAAAELARRSAAAASRDSAPRGEHSRSPVAPQGDVASPPVPAPASAPARAPASAPDHLNDDGFYEPVFYLKDKRSSRRRVVWMLAVFLFLAAPIALLVALLH